MIALPTTSGWMVSWYTGETKVSKKTGKTRRLKGMYESTSKEKVEEKKRQLEAEGYEIEGIYECIF